MNLLKSLGILFLPWVLWAEESTSQNEEVTEEPNKEAEVKLSENLKTNNPFVPYKSSGNTANLVATDSSDFEFCSFAEYPTHQEFSLKDKDSGKTFWLSSDGKDKGLDFGIKYWNFYPNDHLLVIQEISSGTLINMIQKAPVMDTPKSSSLSTGGSSEDFLRMLAEIDDFDDELDEKGGEK